MKLDRLRFLLVCSKTTHPGDAQGHPLYGWGLEDWGITYKIRVRFKDAGSRCGLGAIWKLPNTSHLEEETGGRPRL